MWEKLVDERFHFAAQPLTHNSKRPAGCADVSERPVSLCNRCTHMCNNISVKRVGSQLKDAVKGWDRNTPSSHHALLRQALLDDPDQTRGRDSATSCADSPSIGATFDRSKPHGIDALRQ